MKHVPKSHPRAKSLEIRAKLVRGFDDNLVAKEGLIAHGRGEAFDYIIGEDTSKFAQSAIKAAAAMLLLAKNPVICVNGNIAALCPSETIRLAKVTKAALEVNLFYDSLARRQRIAARLESLGAVNVLGAKRQTQMRLRKPKSSRAVVDKNGIAKADVVMVSLEDGDRTKALVDSGIYIIAIDLNPLSRTARTADITIVDNVTRAMKLLSTKCAELDKVKKSRLVQILKTFDNNKILENHITEIDKYLGRIARNAKNGN